ncbi:H-NS histone family protein [Octadecabacter sp. G9-8]|uniref:H-NS histone family protein n=1 Tax=Octadecabacter dasysiphoniae TaxID=2909341 RepID=A0ABS9CRW1_9RHOB|nr:H-NS histone family protein [Octadecabacter dasysiphoniae]MCF2869604.1 H-NS histone family protein [Octadecabacter dasysiphoniae]
MKFDLKIMTRKELEKLGADVEKALEKLRKKDLKKVRAEMEKLAAAHGVSLEDVVGGQAPAKKAPKAKSAPKYANPDDKSQTWTGKGRQPVWYKSAIEAGKSPESMAI